MLTGFGSKLAVASKSSPGGLGGWIWGLVKQAGGWLISKLWSWVTSFISWSFTSIVQWIQQTVEFVWNFDWNQIDEQLDAQVKAGYQALLTQAAGTLGAALGWVVGGLGPGVLMFVFNVPLAIFMLNNSGQEMVEELLPQIGSLIRSTMRTVTRHALVSTYKRLRKRLIGANEFKPLTDSQIAARYNARVKAGQMSQAEANQAIEKGKQIRDAANRGFERQPWSFAKKAEEWKEKYIPKQLQDAAEEFADEFKGAFWEGLFINAASADEWIMKQRLARPAILGSQTGVRIQFNRDIATPTSTPTPTPTP
jgi:hypothetical protein